MYQVDVMTRAPDGLTLNNPTQARQGAVWGHATHVLACVPEARALNPSVFEEVLLSYDKPTFFKQGTVLFFKADPFMMFFLSFDIVHYRIFVVDAIGEGCILMSPAIEMGECRISLEPLAGKGLHRLYILRDRDGGRERNKNMYMVGHTANAVNLTMQIVSLLHDDRIEFAVVLDGDSLLTPICTKHYMIERLDITHGRITKGRGKYCDGFESASLRDAVGLPRDQPHTALRLCGVIENLCLRHNRKFDKKNSGERFPHGIAIIGSLCLRHRSRA